MNLPSEHVGMLMEGVCTVCSVLPSDKLPEAVSKTSRIAVSMLSHLDMAHINQISREELIKALVMLSGCVKALDHLPATVLKQALLPMIESVWDNLCKLL